MENRFETFTALIAKINRNIKKIKNQEMAEYDLRSAHVSCLYYLYTEEGLTATDLCWRCEEDKATISRTLEYLASRGFLADVGRAKRYKYPLTLTVSGRALGAVIAEKVDRVLHETEACLTEAERVALYRGLSAISERLDEICHRLDS